MKNRPEELWDGDPENKPSETGDDHQPDRQMMYLDKLNSSWSGLKKMGLIERCLYSAMDKTGYLMMMMMMEGRKDVRNFASINSTIRQ